MKIAIVGTGYVGLVTGTCLADSGNEVTCVDQDDAMIERLSQGKVPLYEPGLQEMVVCNAAAGRLHFTTQLEDAVRSAHLVVVAVGTPSAEDAHPDLSSFWSVVDQIALPLATDATVVIKSTVPVGTNARAAERLRQKTGRECDVASNPEFLKQGAAIHDFLYPDRIVVGVRRAEIADKLHELYRPFLRTDRPFLVMSPESAELAKYAANALLSTKISFMNELAHVCDHIDADIDDVRRAVGHDQRIGLPFLFPGIGYGGIGLPKDLRALAALARQLGLQPRLLDAVDAVNEQQKATLFEKIRDYFGEALPQKTIALWGLAFKPRTDDIRAAPSLVLIERLLEIGVRLCVHDPEAMPKVRLQFGDRLLYGNHPLDVLVGADALAINTEWGEYRTPDFAEMRKRMTAPVIFDGRNLYDPAGMKTAGFTYHSIGRKSPAG